MYVKNTITYLPVILAALVSSAAAQPVGIEGGVVVANRASGSISVIDVATSNVTNFALPMPAGDNTPEPMYVTYSAINDLVFVGDRANNRVVAFNALDYSVNTTIPTGAGVFHMWSDDTRNQLWVNNDIDNTVTSIDLTTLAVQTTFNTSADLTALGGKPHDVILDPNASVGYVTMIGVTDPTNPNSDFVVAFDSNTFTEIDRQAVGDDPHVALSDDNNLLFVPTQGADAVAVLNRTTLDPETGSPIAVPNAHGAAMTSDGSVFFTTNISDGGTDALFAIDTATLMLVGGGTPDSTSFPTPHNIALSPDNSLLYITHSGGTSDKVSIFNIASPTDPMLLGTVDVGLNPFGLAAVPAVPEPTSLMLLGLGAMAIIVRRRNERSSRIGQQFLGVKAPHEMSDLQ